MSCALSWETAEITKRRLSSTNLLRGGIRVRIVAEQALFVEKKYVMHTRPGMNGVVKNI